VPAPHDLNVQRGAFSDLSLELSVLGVDGRHVLAVGAALRLAPVAALKFVLEAPDLSAKEAAARD